MFNKEMFKNYLLKARGKRTNEAFSKESGVSRTYISTYLNMKRNEPPTPEILRKLSNASYNNVTYEDLMRSAGHLNDFYTSNNINTNSLLEEDHIYEIDDIDNIVSNSITDDIKNLSTESKKELEKYIKLLKLKDIMEKTKDETSSTSEPKIS